MSAPLPIPTPRRVRLDGTLYEDLPSYLERRPESRAECPPAHVQCPWVSCRYHLALDLGQRRHAARVTLHADPDTWTPNTQTCALHVAEAGAATLEEVGDVMGGLSRERIRQVEVAALTSLRAQGIMLDMADSEGIDTSAPIDMTRPRASLSRHIPAKAPRRELHEPHLAISPDDIDLASLAAEIDAKRSPNQWADRAARAKATAQSNARIKAATKAPPTTTPRPPSPPSPTPREIPPADLPATQPNDHPEAAVAAALPDPQSQPPEPPPMPNITSRHMYRAEANRAAVAVQKIMDERKVSADALTVALAATNPHIKPFSVATAIRGVISGRYPPTSVWYRRIAIALGVTLSDLCDAPQWIDAVQGEDSPRVSAHVPLHPPSPPPPLPLPATPAEAQPPPAADAPTTTNALAPLLIEAIKQAQVMDKRDAERVAVIDLLRNECDDLREQLADAIKARDAATARLAKIQALMGEP